VEDVSELFEKVRFHMLSVHIYYRLIHLPPREIRCFVHFGSVWQCVALCCSVLQCVAVGK